MLLAGPLFPVSSAISKKLWEITAMPQPELSFFPYGTQSDRVNVSVWIGGRTHWNQHYDIVALLSTFVFAFTKKYAM